MKKILSLTLLGALSAAPAFAQEEAAVSSSSGAAISWATDVHANVDITSYTSITVDGGAGFLGGLHQNMFFHKNVGAFVGVDLAMRAMSLNDSIMAKSLEIPFGFSFRYAMNETIQNSMKIGLFYSKAMTSVFDDVGNAPINLKGGLGLVLGASTFFPITPNFSLGLNSDFRFSFFSPFDGFNGSKRLSVAIGVAGRFSF